VPSFCYPLRYTSRSSSLRSTMVRASSRSSYKFYLLSSKLSLRFVLPARIVSLRPFAHIFTSLPYVQVFTSVKTLMAEYVSVAHHLALAGANMSAARLTWHFDISTDYLPILNRYLNLFIWSAKPAAHRLSGNISDRHSARPLMPT
jgi:hypothetical protein